MNKSQERLKMELEEENEFLRLLLESFEDIKKGRIKEFKFSE